MTFNGYDPKSKCLFSWDKDFAYLGKTDNPPSNSFIVEDEYRQWCEMVGCQFLSGYRRDCVIYLYDGENSVSAYGDMQHDLCKWTNCYDWKRVIQSYQVNAPICVAGPVVNDPKQIAELCKIYPSQSIYVCPMVEELSAFGVLVANLGGKERPRRVNFYVPNKEVLNGEFVEFDEKLDGDGYGRMADIVKQGVSVLNKMMNSVGISPFYGKVIVAGNTSSFIIRREVLDKYFPCEPVSAKLYACSSVPVEMGNTELFKNESGCGSDKVNVVVSSDHIPYLQVFTTFYRVMSGRSFVGVKNSEDFADNIPVFVHNRGYKRRG